MLIHRSRPRIVYWLREFFYFVYNPYTRLYNYVFRPTGEGVKTFVLNNGRLLLVKIGYAHKGWALPGGAVDRGEASEEAAIREVYEESGINVTGLSYITSREYYLKHKLVTVHYYYAETDAEDLVIEDQEIVDAGWFTLDDLPIPHRPKLQQEISIYNDWKYEPR